MIHKQSRFDIIYTITSAFNHPKQSAVREDHTPGGKHRIKRTKIDAKTAPDIYKQVHLKAILTHGFLDVCFLIVVCHEIHVFVPFFFFLLLGCPQNVQHFGVGSE